MNLVFFKVDFEIKTRFSPGVAGCALLFDLTDNGVSPLQLG